jgi:outer membrane immunogenic protein
LGAPKIGRAPPPPTPPPPPPPAEFFILNGASPAFPLLNKNNFASFGESGMIAGVQAGCDLQLTPTWVVGIDADASGPNVSGSTSVGQSGAFIVSGILPTSVGPVPVAVTTTANSAANLSVKTNFISTVTGRLGYSIERGKGLFYAKAGAALANNSYNFSGQVTANSCNTFTLDGTTGVGSCALFNPPFVSPFDFSASETRVGWTVGGGIEWAIFNDWSVKLEYDYLDFGSHNVPLNALGPSSTVNINQRINEVKLGVNYLFGW